MWFDYCKTDNAQKHKAAYQRSIRCQCCVKVHAGAYYYRGYEISNDGGREYPWNWGINDEKTENYFPAKSKKECIDQIDTRCNQGNYPLSGSRTQALFLRNGDKRITI